MAGMEHWYRQLVMRDLRFLKEIVKYCKDHPALENFMKRLVSKHPFHDIVLILYLFFALGIYELGSTHFWLISLNLSVSFLIRKLLEAKRPVEYDRSLQPLTDISAESYGFPSLESHMSVVIFGHLCLSFNAYIFIPLAIIFIPLIGFTRLYSRARFPHQVILSWLTGMIGLYLGLHCCDFFGMHRMHHRTHVCCVLATIAAMICHLCLNIENNDSRILSIPKSEYVNVLSSILSSNSLPNERDATSGDKTKGSQTKRDSFYFLQRSLESRRSWNPRKSPASPSSLNHLP